ncbi:MAG: hypothetical protein RI894_733 [Bacteroidota bacterium]
MLFRNLLGFIAAAWCLPFWAQAQVIISAPAFPSEQDSILVTFDATQGNAGLAGYTGDVYAHTGVISNLSTSTSDWKHVKAGWAVQLPECKMTRDAANPNLYRIMIRPSVRSFYGITSASETAQQLAFVFRNVGGTLTGKTAAGGDIFLPLYAPGSILQTNIQTPASDYGVYTLNSTISLTANASISADLQYLLDGAPIASQPNATQFAHSLTVATGGNHTIAFVATTATQHDTAFYHYTVPNTTVQDAPAGTVNGPNYISPTNIRLKLTAPNKSNVYVTGSFNNWLPSAAYQMNKSVDGT